MDRSEVPVDTSKIASWRENLGVDLTMEDGTEEQYADTVEAFTAKMVEAGHKAKDVEKMRKE